MRVRRYQYSISVSRNTQIHTALAVIVERVIGIHRDQVVPQAHLYEDLGIDSLSILEVCEALAQHFDTYLPDDVINRLTTVEQLVHAVAHQGTKPPRGAVVAQRPQTQRPSASHSAGPPTRGSAPTAQVESPVAEQPAPDSFHASSLFAGTLKSTGDSVRVGNVTVTKTKAKRWAVGIIIIGVALGLVFGLVVIGLVRAAGLGDVTLAPADASSATPASSTPSSATPTKSPTPTETTQKPKKKPSLKADSKRVSPGEKLELTGAMPELDAGVTLQVQSKDADEDWDDFPVTTITKDKGKFSAIIHTERPGKRKLRLIDKGSETSTPAVSVTVG